MEESHPCRSADRSLYVTPRNPDAAKAGLVTEGLAPEDAGLISGAMVTQNRQHGCTEIWPTAAKSLNVFHRELKMWIFTGNLKDSNCWWLI